MFAGSQVLSGWKTRDRPRQYRVIARGIPLPKIPPYSASLHSQHRPILVTPPRLLHQRLQLLHARGAQPLTPFPDRLRQRVLHATESPCRPLGLHPLAANGATVGIQTHTQRHTPLLADLPRRAEKLPLIVAASRPIQHNHPRRAVHDQPAEPERLRFGAHLLLLCIKRDRSEQSLESKLCLLLLTLVWDLPASKW